MERGAFFVDGFNLYHALQANPAYAKYKWLNLDALAKAFMRTDQQVSRVYYFTAYATWDPGKMARHQALVRALESVGVEVIMGRFKYKERFCTKCRTMYPTFEEKETDVNIAINLFRAAVMDIYDTAVIVSGDSDLIPSVKAVKATFPAKKVGVIVPIGRSAEDLKQNCHFRFKMKEKHLATCQFPDPVVLAGGATLHERP